jgi:hypothetical protein
MLLYIVLHVIVYRLFAYCKIFFFRFYLNRFNVKNSNGDVKHIVHDIKLQIQVIHTIMYNIRPANIVLDFYNIVI